MRELRHAFLSGLLLRSARDFVLPMTKTKSKITLKELREKWIEGGYKRAANLTAKRRMDISRAATLARQVNAKARREAKANAQPLVAVAAPEKKV